MVDEIGITLPAGHTWHEVESGEASVTRFECSCGAWFEHDGMDGSQTFVEGDGHEAEDDDGDDDATDVL